MRFRLYLECVNAISEVRTATGIIHASNLHGMKPLIEFATEEQKKRPLPCIAAGGLGAPAITEPNAGLDATGMRTRFRAEGDECSGAGV